MLVVLGFLITLLFILVRPWNLKIYVLPSFMAILFFALGYVGMDEVKNIFNLIWDSALSLIGLVILALSLEKLGFFNSLIFIIFRICNRAKHKHFFVIKTHQLVFLLFIFVFIFAGILANDGAILIFTPLVVGILSYIPKADAINKTNVAYYKTQGFSLALCFGISFICDAGSNALIISNLTNIITASFFDIGFSEFAKTMFLPNVFGVGIFIILFFYFFTKKIPPFIHLRKSAYVNILTLKEFYFYVILLVSLYSCFFALDFLNLPNCALCLTSAFIFFILMCKKHGISSFKILKNVPYSITIFVFALSLIVLALFYKLENFIEVTHIFLNGSLAKSIAFMSVFSLFGASIFNNLPMAIIGNFILNDFFHSSLIQVGDKIYLVYAHLLACNIGSKLTPIGSLCTLLWLEILQKNNIPVSLKTYFSFSIIFTCCSLVVATLVLILISL